MTFPVEAAATGGANAAGTSHTVTMPSGVVAGDLLIVVFHYLATGTITFPAGWTIIAGATDAGVQRTAVRYKVSDGTEGASITVTTASNAKSVYRSLRITSHDPSAAPETLISSFGSGTTPDPPSLNPSTWEAEDTLWYAVEVGNDQATTVSSYPANYTGGVQHVTTAGGNHGQLAIANRTINTSAEDPGTFTLGGGGTRVAGITIGIRPRAQDLGRPYGGAGQRQMHQLLAA